MIKRKPLWETSDWTFSLIEKVDQEIEKLAHDKYGLDTYPNQIEIISSEQMLYAYSSIGMPIMYEHWSYGKHLVHQQQSYKRGQMGLAYEIVLNSNPCISYLMEENSMTMQALVIAHACYGHNSFFKNNYLFQQWTDADHIIDYLIFARNYIRECEEKHGYEKVEELLDSCHALMNYGVDRYKKPKILSVEEEKERQIDREEYRQSQVNDIWKSLPKHIIEKDKKKKKKKRFPETPIENILLFIEENAPLLKPWEREIIRIIRNVAQYFYPQRQTAVMNEGWATFIHYTLMNDLEEQNLMPEGAWLEFLNSHTNVIMQPEWDSKFYNGINVYTLGFNIFRDIKRMCVNPTAEDKKWFPDIANSNWIETIKFAMENYKDESFLLQYLSPKVIRDLKIFAVKDNENNQYNYVVSNIHNDDGYRQVRSALSDQYNLNFRDPDIQVYKIDKDGNRDLYLRHFRYNDVSLHKDVEEVLKHVSRLWGFGVILQSVDSKGTIKKEFKIDKPE